MCSSRLLLLKSCWRLVLHQGRILLPFCSIRLCAWLRTFLQFANCASVEVSAWVPQLRCGSKWGDLGCWVNTNSMDIPTEVNQPALWTVLETQVLTRRPKWDCGFFFPWMVFSLPRRCWLPARVFFLPWELFGPLVFFVPVRHSVFRARLVFFRPWMVFCGAAGVYCSLKGVYCSQRSGFVWRSERVFIVP